MGESLGVGSILEPPTENQGKSVKAHAEWLPNVSLQSLILHQLYGLNMDADTKRHNVLLFSRKSS